MRKIQKIIAGTMLPVSLTGVFVASCSNTNKNLKWMAKATIPFNDFTITFGCEHDFREHRHVTMYGDHDWLIGDNFSTKFRPFFNTWPVAKCPFSVSLTKEQLNFLTASSDNKLSLNDCALNISGGNSFVNNIQAWFTTHLNSNWIPIRENTNWKDEKFNPTTTSLHTKDEFLWPITCQDTAIAFNNVGDPALSVALLNEIKDGATNQVTDKKVSVYTSCETHCHDVVDDGGRGHHDYGSGGDEMWGSDPLAWSRHGTLISFNFNNLLIQFNKSNNTFIISKDNTKPFMSIYRYVYIQPERLNQTNGNGSKFAEFDKNQLWFPYKWAMVDKSDLIDISIVRAGTSNKKISANEPSPGRWGDWSISWGTVSQAVAVGGCTFQFDNPLDEK